MTQKRVDRGKSEQVCPLDPVGANLLDQGLHIEEH